MKISKSVIVAFVLLVVVAALYRVVPNRPMGFAPQYAMALFGGVMFRHDKKWAFALPVFSLFLSDLLYQLLYNAGVSATAGFYEGQWQNYLLFGLLASIGFLVKRVRVVSIAAASVVAPTVFFLVSNFLVWAGTQGTRGLNRPKTFDGLMQCYADGLPFFPNTLYGTLFFSVVLFGGYFLLKQNQSHQTPAVEKASV